MVLQNMRSESDRLLKIVEFVKAYLPKREYAGRMKHLAATNGAGHRPADL
jgi:hypothetical protein